MSRRRDSPWPPVLAGGLLAGTLDILYACLFWAVKADVPPSRIFQSVAAGLLGEASFRGGTFTAALGLFLHFLIACTMALVYYLAARRWPVLVRRPVILGIAYGLLLYVVMNYVVVPLSAAGAGSSDPTWITLTVAAHAFLVGLPIAWFASRAAVRQHA
jgi:uncharacterized membrane protein YagU involved in acid resistance